MALPSGAAEYFVGKQGNDTNDGQARDKSFLTIQKGLNILKPGDTLTIGPGEYFECVKLVNLGSPEQETLVRAEIPGTVLLRGDRDAAWNFKRVEGRRFVYVTDHDQAVLSVNEVDTLMTLARADDADTLEFSPGKYYFDAPNKKLYLSSSDFQPPDHHRYTVGNLKDHGFLLRGTKRVTLDGLAAAGYLSATNAALLFPSSGFLLHETKFSVVRRCAAFLNGSGITLNTGTNGCSNIVTECRAYGNMLDGIVGYNPNGETIRDSHCFLNRTYGARYYARRSGEGMCLLYNLLAWGNPGGDYWFKGFGLSGGDKHALAEKCVGLKDVFIHNTKQCITGGGPAANNGDPTMIVVPAEAATFDHFTDREFADPMNFDYRLQETSPFRQPGANYAYRGAYPYETNIYYIKGSGDDSLNGLSMSNAWKTVGHAIKQLKPGDTLYIAGGSYSNDISLTARNIKIRGRGLAPVVMDGFLNILQSEDVAIERIQFTGAVRVEKSRDIAVANCVFSGGGTAAAGGMQGVLSRFTTGGAAGGVDFEGVDGLRFMHNVMAVPLQMKKCSKALLSGNLFGSLPAVRADKIEQTLCSSYNSYADAASCWEIGGIKASLDEIQKTHDTGSIILKPDIAVSNGVASVINECKFAGRGPLGTSIGLYREWQPKSMRLVGPFVHSVSETTANLEWWTTLPVSVELCWGDTPDCTNAVAIRQNSFYSYSLTGLEPGRKYYARLKPTQLNANADPARRFRISGKDWAAVEFTTSAKAGNAPQTYYVSTKGNNSLNGLSRETAWKTLQYAADHVRPGDTVLLAGGKYSGTVYFRVTGDKGKPITFKAVPGEQAIVYGAGAKVGLVLYKKHYYNFDSLYIKEFAGIEDNLAGAENGALYVHEGSDLRVTRCHFSEGWGPSLAVSQCAGFQLKNCVVMHSMGSATFSRCPGLAIENNVFIQPLIHNLTVGNGAVEPALVANNIFGENTRGKTHICFVSLSGSTVESNNCFYLRWPEDERPVVNNLTLPEYRAVKLTDSIAANPMMPGASGWCQGWGPIASNEFNALFASNPELVRRGIGLQPEQFRDFHFKLTNWVYNVAWANDVLARKKAADDLFSAGNYAGALEACTAMTNMPMHNSLKSELLQKAAICANSLKQYDRAINIASNIPIKLISVNTRMKVMAENGKNADVLNRFSRAALGGEDPLLGWRCTEKEDMLVETYNLRATAYAESNDFKSAEADLRKMIDAQKLLTLHSSAGTLDLAWLRFGDYCRKYLKDDEGALAAYTNVLARTVVFYWDVPVPKPVLLGNSQAYRDAVQAASEIYRKQGKEAEALKLQSGMLKAQAEAYAALRNRQETIAKFRELLTAGNSLTGNMEASEKRINGFDVAARSNAVAQIAGTIESLREATIRYLITITSDADAEAAKAALRAIIAFAPPEKTTEILDKAEKEGRQNAVRASLDPAIKRLRALAQAQKWQDLVNEFKDTDFAGWQDNDFSGEAFNLRGTAYYNLKNGEKSESDLKKAVEKKPDPYVWFTFAENYRENLKNDDKALDAYVKVNELTAGSYGWVTSVSVFRAVDILRARNKNEEALKILETFKVDEADGDYRRKKLLAFEETLVALNRKVEAIAKYQYVLALKNVTPAEKAEFEKRVNALRGDVAQSPEK
jgi:tetratricopeptide (TPR) repeat protein